MIAHFLKNKAKKQIPAVKPEWIVGISKLRAYN